MAGPNFGSDDIVTEGAVLIGRALPRPACPMPGDKILMCMDSQRLFALDENGSVNMTQASGTGDPVLRITSNYGNNGLNIFQGGPNHAIYVEKSFVAEDPRTATLESAGSCIYAYQQGTSPAIRVNVTNRGGEGILVTCHSNKTAMDISSNGGFNAPQVVVQQTRSNNFARLRFKIRDLPDDDHWDIAVGRSTENQMRFYRNGTGNIMILDPDGRVGIGTDRPNRTLTVNGSIGSPVATYHSSDSRMKQNIRPIDQPLDKIRSIRGVSYEWKRENFPQINFPEGTQLGVIGQEVEQVLPEVVDQDEEGYLSVQYEGLIPVLIEAIKEQQKEIEDLKATVKSLITEKTGKKEKSN